ncbi:MAG: SDR family NAD(P)-dependent oxidoreductase, partial [Candidatus Thermoplasmatota archaeon]|nr:SDR family NAD(P)-dependent oxidoreductase [Candidatus Thermoplasmatota archaeon]
MTEATVIVTGADGGMGSALVDRLLSMTNWDILAIDRNQIEERNRLSTLTVNLLDSNIEELVNDSINHLPSVIGLVNLAAISKGDELIEMDDESWTHSMKLNVTTPMLLARTIIPKMMENRGGSIVNVGSPVGFIGARKPSYSASKAALHGLTMSIARQYGKFGIRCNTLLPGAT